MSARLLLLGILCALTSVLACSCSAPRSPAQRSPERPSAPSAPVPADSPRAKDFEATIARLERTDPASTAVLNVQLDYAEFLLGAAPGPCAERLERAQEQLGSVDANPKTQVMFPDGWASVANLEYRLHIARAECNEADRKNELWSAVAAARRAVELYRNVFDYRSMVIMQFDASTALHQLGDDAAALQALTATLDMDREFGFKDDAAENYELLLTWRGEPAGDAQVAQLMREFPKRQAMLKFAWRPSATRVRLESRRECLDEGQVLTSHAAATFEGHTGTDPGGWKVSYSHRLTQYEPGVWPAMPSSQIPPMTFPAALLPAAGFKVSATGEFLGVTDSDSFAPRLAAKAEGLIRSAAPPGNGARRLTEEAVETSANNLTSGMLEAAAAQSYQLETAMWIGATLDQGVWYQVDAPLSLPGIPRVVVQNRVEFAFTRRVPCTAGAPEQACVEIVIHATPDKEALDRVTADLMTPTPDQRVGEYTASIEARIVTDPATLLPYAREERIYWYASIGKGKSDSILQSEHLVSTTSYGAT